MRPGGRIPATLDLMAEFPLSIGFVMLHTSPLDVPGTKDAGGMNVVVRAQAKTLAREGQIVRIFTRRSDPEAPRIVEIESGLTVVHLDAGPPEVITKGDHEGVVAEFSAALIDELTRDPVDLLHAEHWFSGIAALPAARQLGVPLAQSFHSIAAAPDTPLAEGERPESPGRIAGEQRLADEADLVIAVSEAEKRTVVEKLGGQRVTVVPLGVDTELFHPVDEAGADERSEWRACGGRPEVLVVGRLHPLKGFDLAVAAIAAIPAERRPVLRIVGSPPPDGTEYAELLHDSVVRSGMLTTTAYEGGLRRTELAERMRAADLVLVPSHSETFGLVALEAAASEVPVIARAAGGLREAVLDGRTGVLIDGGDPAEWAREIDRLLGDPDLSASMGHAAREHALTRNWRASTDKLLAVYCELLEGWGSR